MVGTSATTCPVIPGAVRTELQRATADIHEALHMHPAFVRLMSGALMSPDYSALLKRLYGFYLPLEATLRRHAVPFAPVDLLSRETGHLLHDDLVALGIPAAERFSLPMCDGLPTIESQEDIMGCLYVIEGAGRGGRIMAKRLDYLLGPNTTAGRTFLLGRPNPDPLPWDTYCQRLEAYGEQGDLGEIIDAAQSTFRAFEVWLSKGYYDV